MKQPHTEQSIKHTGDQQNTGNHKEPGAKDAGGADQLGGTRAGAENVEHGAGAARDGGEQPVETGADIHDVPGLEGVDAENGRRGGLTERHPERDENGRL